MDFDWLSFSCCFKGDKGNISYFPVTKKTVFVVLMFSTNQMWAS